MNLNCFTSAYHKLVADSNKMNKAAYDMIYTSLNSVYEDRIIESMDANTSGCGKRERGSGAKS